MNFSRILTVTVSNEPKSNCLQLRLIAVYCIFIFFSSLFLNSCLLLIFFSNKHLRTTYNVFIIAIVLVNLLATLTTLPLVIVSNLYCRWKFGAIGCTLGAFFIFWTGSSNIYILTALSYSHYSAIRNKIMGKDQSKDIRKPVQKIAICISISLIWAFAPLFGLSNYNFEGLGTNCSLASNKNRTVFCYNLTVYLIPLLSIGYSILKLIRLQKHINRNKFVYVNMKSLRRRFSTERDLIIVTVSLVCCFLITWLPYTIVSFFKVIIDEELISPLTSTLTAIFAKSSPLCSSLFYVVVNPKIRQKLRRFVFKFRLVDDPEIRMFPTCISQRELVESTMMEYVSFIQSTVV